jgi:hypothetical protein
MEIISNAPFAEVIAFGESKPYGKNLYNVQVDSWINRFSVPGKEPYKTLPGDILVLANAKPEDVSDLQRTGWQWAFVTVTKIPEDEENENTSFTVKALEDIGIQQSLFLIFLINRTTNKRIWNSLHTSGNLEIIKNVLNTNSFVSNLIQKSFSISFRFNNSFHAGIYAIKSDYNQINQSEYFLFLMLYNRLRKMVVSVVLREVGIGMRNLGIVLLLN